MCYLWTAVAGPSAPPLRHLRDALLDGAVPFLVVAVFFSCYGQLHRKPSGDTYATVYTAVAIVHDRTIWLDRYLDDFRDRAGKHPYMLAEGREGRLVNRYPAASSLLAVPAVAAYSAAGVAEDDWDAWMDAGQLTAAGTTALSVAVLFLLLTRLTSRGRAFLVAAIYAWGTIAWTVAGQALWQHGGAMLALLVALLAFVDRRPLLAGAALASAVAFRPSAAVVALFLLPLVGRRAADWARFGAGAAPVVLLLGAYNAYVFGSPARQGYASTWLGSAESPAGRETFGASIVEGLPGVLASPGRGLLVYSPVLTFAALGAIRGRRVALYRWAAVAAAAHIVLIARFDYWWGGQTFGPRLLAEAVPLLALLLAPALDSLGRVARWAFGATVAWSVGVQLVGAAAWPPPLAIGWDEQVLASTWWSLEKNELLAALGRPDIVPRLATMLAILVAAALAAGVAALAYAWLRELVRPAPERPARLG